MKVLKDSKLGDLKLSTVHTKPKKVNQPVNSFFLRVLFCVCTLKLEGTVLCTVTALLENVVALLFGALTIV